MRVVSLVPSATESLLALDIRPVACTRFCEQPDLLTVGGTKDPDLAAILALAPDLVVVNDEENRRDDAEALAAAGLAVHSMSPRSVQDVGPALAMLATVLGLAPPTLELPSARALLRVGRAPAVLQCRRLHVQGLRPDCRGCVHRAGSGRTVVSGSGRHRGALRPGLRNAPPLGASRTSGIDHSLVHRPWKPEA